MLRKMMFSSFVNKCHENQKSKLLKIVLSTAKILPISNDQKTIKNHHLMSYFSSEKKMHFLNKRRQKIILESKQQQLVEVDVKKIRLLQARSQKRRKLKKTNKDSHVYNFTVPHTFFDQ
jgi:hypothetical protein